MTPEELREARRKLGLFQWELYDMAKFGRASGRSAQKVHVSRMENGKRPISAEHARRVRALLKWKGFDDE